MTAPAANATLIPTTAWAMLAPATGPVLVRLMPSRWVGLLQVRQIPVSEYVALRLPLPGSLSLGLSLGSGRSCLIVRMHMVKRVVPPVGLDIISCPAILRLCR